MGGKASQRGRVDTKLCNFMQVLKKMWAVTDRTVHMSKECFRKVENVLILKSLLKNIKQPTSEIQTCLKEYCEIFVCNCYTVMKENRLASVRTP